MIVALLTGPRELTCEEAIDYLYQSSMLLDRDDIDLVEQQERSRALQAEMRDDHLQVGVDTSACFLISFVCRDSSCVIHPE